MQLHINTMKEQHIRFKIAVKKLGYGTMTAYLRECVREALEKTARQTPSISAMKVQDFLGLPIKQLQKIDKLVESGKFKNLNHVICAALKELLET